MHLPPLVQLHVATLLHTSSFSAWVGWWVGGLVGDKSKELVRITILVLMKLCVGLDYDYTANVNNSDSHIEEKDNVLDADIKIAKA